ncbi:MAG: hypothetical protein MHMPM18_005190 [Marteilia pararefringens]
MGSKVELSESRRQQIVNDHKNGTSMRKIASIFYMELFFHIFKVNYGISRSAVARAVEKNKYGESLASKPRSGRPCKVSSRDTSFLVREVITSPRQARQIWLLIFQTAANRRFPLQLFAAVKKPFLTKSMKAKRVECCNRYKDMPVTFWEQVMFSDKTMVCIDLSSVMNRVRRFP